MKEIFYALGLLVLIVLFEAVMVNPVSSNFDEMTQRVHAMRSERLRRMALLEGQQVASRHVTDHARTMPVEL